MPAATKIDWVKAKAYYIGNAEISLAKVAKKFGVSKASVSEHAKKERWTKNKEMVQDKVDQDLTNQVAQQIIDVKIRHAKIAEGMLDMVESALERVNHKNEKTVKITTPKDMKEVAVAAVSLHRQALNLEDEKPPVAPIQILIVSKDGGNVDISRV